MFEMGTEVRDKITKFTGVVTGKSEYITGCTQYLLQPPCAKDTGAFVNGTWFDENRLELVNAVRVLKKSSRNVGPGLPAPIK